MQRAFRKLGADIHRVKTKTANQQKIPAEQDTVNDRETRVIHNIPELNERGEHMGISTPRGDKILSKRGLQRNCS